MYKCSILPLPLLWNTYKIKSTSFPRLIPLLTNSIPSGNDTQQVSAHSAGEFQNRVRVRLTEFCHQWTTLECGLKSWITFDRKVVVTWNLNAPPRFQGRAFQWRLPFVCASFRSGDTPLFWASSVCISGTEGRTEKIHIWACSAWSNYGRRKLFPSL